MIFHKVSQNKQSAFNTTNRKTIQSLSQPPSTFQWANCGRFNSPNSPLCVTEVCCCKVPLPAQKQQKYFLGVLICSILLLLNIKLMQFIEEKTFCSGFQYHALKRDVKKQWLSMPFPPGTCCQSCYRHGQERRCSLLSVIFNWTLETW